MRSVDPFLNAHLVDSYVFHIGGRLWPISIRDQMLRGRLIIDRALEQRFIHKNRSVAVVGAGAAGVTAALRAARRGVSVTLFEKERLFARHALCRTRFVNPTQYEWPAGHWDAAAVPWPGTPVMPLTWERPDFADALALEGETQFLRQYPRIAPFLTVRLPVTVRGFNAPGGGPSGLVQVDWLDTAGVNKQNDFGMVVWAVGFGEEKSYLYPQHPYRGFEFWANDPFALPNLGCSAPPHVLISGAGDGGLQDFLRITTKCKSAEEIWKSLPASTHQTLGELRDIEEQAFRAFILGPGLDSSSDCPMLNHLHVFHETFAETVHKSPRVQRILDGLIRRDFASVKMVYPCTHFSQGYGLNRFLVLLVSRHLEMVRPDLQPILLPGRMVVEIRCQGGHGPGNPAVCHGQPHEVWTLQKNNCASISTPTGSPDKLLEVFDVVIIRHGIEPAPLRAGKGQGAPMPPLRQVLPYYLPI